MNSFSLCVSVCARAWYLIKDPDLPVDRGSRHPVTVVVEEHSLLLSVTPQRRAQLLHLVHCGVQALLVTCLKNKGASEESVRSLAFYLLGVKKKL